MKILICPDKFKGTLTALEVCEAIRRGLPGEDGILLPISDGGEGTVDAFCAAMGGKILDCPAHDPLMRPITASFGRLPDGSAIVELSAASGLHRVAESDRAPLQSNTFGTGEVMLAAAEGAASLIVGLGGSATNDAGVGMASALGFRFLDSLGRDQVPIPANFPLIAKILPPARQPLPPCLALCDVSNPLTGTNGATHVFGPQKGVAVGELESLDHALSHLADIVAKDLGVDPRENPGAGAAGGMGYGMMAFLGAELKPGFEVLAEITRLAGHILDADLIITGEGCLDEQSMGGKGPWGVARMAREAGRRVVCIPGRASLNPAVREGFDAIFPLVREGTPLSEAMEHPGKWLELRAQEAVAWMKDQKTQEIPQI